MALKCVMLLDTFCRRFLRNNLKSIGFTMGAAECLECKLTLFCPLFFRLNNLP